MPEFRIETFDAAKHLRVGFDCGKPALDEFLQTLVSQYEKRRLGKTCVAVGTGGTDQVIGYYTLAASAVSFDNIPLQIAKKLPRHPLPTILVARLAVDRRAQGTGLGKALLYDALRQALGISKLLGVFAIDEQAAGFYAKFGFASLLDDPQHMYLPIRTIEEASA